MVRQGVGGLRAEGGNVHTKLSNRVDLHHPVRQEACQPRPVREGELLGRERAGRPTQRLVNLPEMLREPGRQIQMHCASNGKP
eukprot:scaffold36975_cov63-Phaeocystis_antarctica.AAC.2